MPVTVEWDNPEHTILRTESHGHWTWDEYHHAVDQALVMIKGVDHPVDLINMRAIDAITPPGNALPHLRRVMRDLPDNHRLTIMVNPNMQSKLMVGIFKRLVPVFTRTFQMVPSLQEARELIAHFNREKVR